MIELITWAELEFTKKICVKEMDLISHKFCFLIRLDSIMDENKLIGCLQPIGASVVQHSGCNFGSNDSKWYKYCIMHI